jgi:TIR domain-containing protein/pentapeptide repeat protein
MANKKHLSMLKKKGGVSAWNKWRSEHPEIVPDLREADLRGADLRGADLRMANLAEANLAEANLTEANLRGADLRGAGLNEVNLYGADLTETNLYGADLRGAGLNEVNLYRADLTETNLRGADLSNSRMGNTSVSDINLSGVKGLETVGHIGPSSIGIDTIYRSKGEIPEVFLRRAGVPDNFIAYMKSLAGTPLAFEYYSCFISYSSEDEAFAKCLYVDLQSKGVRCWFAPHDMQGGRKLEEQIDVAIRLHERLLLILSPDSMNSEWVKTEIAKARKREVQEKKKVLFPVRLVPFKVIEEWECFDADMGKDSAREIREYFIPDFSDWENPARYKAAFDRLLSDLKANDTARPQA